MLALNPLLNDFAVLQAEQDILISGNSNPHEMLSLQLDDFKTTTISDEEGNFIFEIPSQPYGKCGLMSISNSSETKSFKIQYGDVFLFAGQSNIEYYMQNEKHFKEELDSFDDEYIYFNNVPQIEYESDNETSSNNMQWIPLTRDTLKDISAIAYYTVKEHRRNHPNTIIGVVSCSKGGTSASCWLSEHSAKANYRINHEIIKPFEKDTKGKSKEDFDQELDSYMKTSKEYYGRKDEMIKKFPHYTMGEIKKEIGNSPWPPPANPYLFTRPCGLYYTMFKKIVPYSFLSVVWYQGEEDTQYGDLYKELLKELLTLWREDLKSNVPFYIVQLPICKDREHHNWTAVRKAQQTIVENDKRAYLITSLDCGEIDDIHPSDKSILGKRISEIMNRKHYSSSPIAHIKKWEAQELIIECNNTKLLHLKTQDVFHTDVQIDSINIKDNCIYIHSKTQIKTISYGCENAFEVALFNEVGYPVSPFSFVYEVKKR